VSVGTNRAPSNDIEWRSMTNRAPRDLLSLAMIGTPRQRRRSVRQEAP